MLYYMSQGFILLAAIVGAITYFVKRQDWICALSAMSSLFFASGYGCLEAWSGCVSNAVAAVGYVVFYLYTRKGRQAPSLILMFLLISNIAIGCIDFAGYLSVMSICAGCMFIYSVWQKDNLTYKILGILTCATFAIYNGLYQSWFGMGIEIVLCVVDVVAVIRYVIIERKTKKEERALETHETK